MNLVIITQEERFYIPIMIGESIKSIDGHISVIILPSIPKGFTIFSYISRLFSVFGMIDFLKFGLLYMYYLILDIVTFFLKAARFYSVKSAVVRNHLKIYSVDNINSDKSINLIKELAPDVIISIASPQIFKKKLICSAKYVINVHAALLPKYQGMMPSFWVLAKKENDTGVTAHYVTEHIDGGEIILQKTIDISSNETLHSLQTKVAYVGSMVLVEALKRINIDHKGYPQKGQASYYSFPTKEAAKEFRSVGRKFI
jgi:methionyl-tRNA formyltransferase